MYVCLAQSEVNPGFRSRRLLRAGQVDDGSSGYRVYVAMSGARCGTLWPCVGRVVVVSSRY